MDKQKQHSSWMLLGGMLLVLSMSSHAQIRTIPKEGIAGLSKEALEFEIEHNYRRESGLGGTVPAEPGTRPNSTNPQVLDGIWLIGRTYAINADGSFTLASDGPPAAAAGMEAAVASAPPAGGGNSRVQCLPGSPFSMGQPSRVIQTDKVIYVFSNSNNNGAGVRRIVMNGTLPTNLTPSYAGYSVAHWEDGTLVVTTTGLKSVGGGGGGPGGVNLSYNASSVVTEHIKKIEGGLKLENIISVANPGTGQPSSLRLVSFYRPDLQYVEAPCEEYTDPFEGKYNAPTGDAAIRATPAQ